MFYNVAMQCFFLCSEFDDRNYTTLCSNFLGNHQLCSNFFANYTLCSNFFANYTKKIKKYLRIVPHLCPPWVGSVLVTEIVGAH